MWKKPNMYFIKISSLVFIILFKINCQTFQKPSIYKKNFNQSILLNLKKGARVVPTVYLSLNTNKKKLKFIIDTGSNASYLDEKFFQKEESIKSYTQLTLPSKKKIIQSTYVQKFSLYHKNQLITKNQFFYSSKAFQKSEVDGLIGLDILKHTILFFEYPNYIGFLHRDDPFIRQFENSNHFQLSMNYINNTIFLDMSLQSPFFYLNNMIFDTGAGITVLKRDFLRKIQSKKIGSITYIDLLNHKKREPAYLLKNLCIRFHCVNNIEFIGVDFLKNFEFTHKRKIAGVLGLNWIERYKILIDIEQKVIRMIPNL